MRPVLILFYILILNLSFFTDPLAAHHGSEGGLTGTPVDPSTGASYQPQSRITWTVSHYRGARENKEIVSSVLNGEMVINEGWISLLAEMPWYYYIQKKIPDASRYGKPRAGIRGRMLPLSGTPFFLTGDLMLGFPTGSDTDKMTEENYFDSAFSITGGVLIDRIAVALQAGNRQPLTRSAPQKNEYDLLPVLPENYTENPNSCRFTRTCVPDTTELKNVYDGSLTFTAAVHSSVTVFISQYARTPFDGILYRRPWPQKDWIAFSEDPEKYYINYLYNKAITNNPELPEVYHETSAGISVKAASFLSLHLIYRYPNERRTHVRSYESSVSAGITFSGGSFHYHDGGFDE